MSLDKHHVYIMCLWLGHVLPPPPFPTAPVTFFSRLAQAFVGKMVADAMGHAGKSAQAFLSHLHATIAPNTTLIMTQGSEGACAVDPQGRFYTAPACPPPR